jgi:hypothetical protein
MCETVWKNTLVFDASAIPAWFPSTLHMPLVNSGCPKTDCGRLTAYLDGSIRVWQDGRRLLAFGLRQETPIAAMARSFD